MTAAEVIRACLPDLADGEGIEPLGEGDFCRAFAVAGRVVRVPRHAEARAALEREACLLPRLAGALPVPVPVPQLFHSADDRHVVAVHDQLSGTELLREGWEALGAPDRRGLAGTVGAFLRQLHGIDPGIGRRCGLRESRVSILAAAVEGRLTEREREATSPLTPELARAVRAELATLRDDSPSPETPALLHGDFGPGHTLYAPDTLEITGVIDWGDALLGDPARDFIFVYEDWGDAFLRLAVESYGPGDPGAFLHRVYRHYLVDQLRWVLDAVGVGARAIEAGVNGLAGAVRDLKAEREQDRGP